MVAEVSKLISEISYTTSNLRHFYLMLLNLSIYHVLVNWIEPALLNDAKLALPCNALIFYWLFFFPF